MSPERESAERWVAEVEAAYADGGYAAGDGPSPPLDEMVWLLGRSAVLEAIVRDLAGDDNPTTETSGGFEVCAYCGEGGYIGQPRDRPEHRPDCVWRRARELMEDSQ